MIKSVIIKNLKLILPDFQFFRISKFSNRQIFKSPPQPQKIFLLLYPVHKEFDPV